jgi:spore coat protein H
MRSIYTKRAIMLTLVAIIVLGCEHTGVNKLYCDLDDPSCRADFDARTSKISNDRSKDQECSPGSKRCGGSSELTPEVCDEKGKWVASGSNCQNICLNGACEGNCSPGTRQCGVNQTPETCGAEGTWEPRKACKYLCSGDGACTGNCKPGATGCSGQIPLTCDETGEWVSGTECVASVCVDGLCADGCAPGDPQCGSNENPSKTLYGLTTIEIDIDDSRFDELVSKTDEDVAIEVPVVVSIGGQLYKEVSIELHGGLARTVNKKSFRLSFSKENPARVTFFSDSMETHRNLVLQASWVDATFMRNKLTMELVRRNGGLAPRIGFAVVSINKKIYGLYTVIERIDRVFIGRQGYYDGDGKFSLYKAYTNSANWKDKDNPLDGYEIKVNENVDTRDLAKLLKTISETSLTKEAFAEKVEPLIDINQFIIWQMVHTFAMDSDCFIKNYYLYHDLIAPEGTEQARFKIISWDADGTWGNFWDGSTLEPSDQRWYGNDGFSPRLFAISEYRNAYLARYRDALNKEMVAEWLLERIDVLSATIKKAVELDYATWERGLNFDGEIERLKDAVRSRSAIMESAISNEIAKCSNSACQATCTYPALSCGTAYCWNLDYGCESCASGYVWREACGSSDKVCVMPESRARRAQENANHVTAQTCPPGYVWREACGSNDNVCVSLSVRDEVANENANGKFHTYIYVNKQP